MHQAQIQGNTFRVVDSGTVASIQDSLTKVHPRQPELANQLQQLTEAIIVSDELSKNQKESAASLLSMLIANFVHPGMWKPDFVEEMRSGLQQRLTADPSLLALWSGVQWAPAI